MESKITQVQGLTLVKGFSAEEAITRLNRADLKFKHFLENPDKVFYFRSICVELDHQEDFPSNKRHLLSLQERDRARDIQRDKVIAALRFPDHYVSGNYSYFAYYKIEKDFDFSTLNGKVSFSDGNLVERVRIYFE